jgi:hypothetical protein
MNPDLLDADYDLRYRPAAGDRSYYELDIVYRRLDQRGLPAQLENLNGLFQRSVERVEASGRVQETVSWARVGRREAADGGDYGPWDFPSWAQGISYPFAAEDSYQDFHWQYDGLPRDDSTWMTSWQIVLLTVDAHFEFDFLRSSRHGGIEKLRRIGDSVLTPDSEGSFWLGLPPVVDVPAFTKPGLRLTFAGLTRRGQHDCALLEFSMGTGAFEMIVAGQRQPMSSTFRGTLAVRLDDGSLESGEFDEFVFSGGVCTNPRYELRRSTAEQWQAATGTTSPAAAPGASR